MQDNGHDVMRSAEERRVLLAGYFSIFTGWHPFTENMRDCPDQPSALLLALEKKYMEIPEELTFNNMEADISPPHKDRIAELWLKVLEMKQNYESYMLALIEKWKNAPDTADADAKRVVKDSPMRIQKKFRAAAMAVISALPPPTDDQIIMSGLKLWQMEEKALRGNFYRADKNYLVAMRLYLEMLLEKPAAQNRKPPVLPLDHPLRGQIMIVNRYLRLIDAFHQGISIGKAGHHAQPNEHLRLRKFHNVPYLTHSLAVTAAYIADVVIYYIEEERLPYNPTIPCTAGPIHDLSEDTRLIIRDILKFLKRLADHYDSKLDQNIESGFGIPRADIKKKILDLVGDHDLRELRAILRILSNNEVLSDKEKKLALQLNPAGQSATCSILQLAKNQYRAWGIEESQLEDPLKTYSRYPLAEDALPNKLDSFLLKLQVLTPNGVRRQHTLLLKIEDRLHNLQDLPLKTWEVQRSTLRITTNRLAAYCMLDFDQNKFPLYNALPRLLDTLTDFYRRFAEAFPQQVEDFDRQLIVQLEQWQSQVKRFPMPAHIQELLSGYGETANDDSVQVADNLFARMKRGFESLINGILRKNE